MAPKLVIYGATGYTGRLIVDEACRRGLGPTLAGRDGAALQRLAGEHGLSFAVAPLDQPGRLCEVLSTASVVINAASPFSTTASALIDVCLEVGVHYTDVCGELLVLESVAARHVAARAKGLMLLPGVGFDVVPSDCLAAHVAHQLPDAISLRIGMTGLTHFSRGSAKTILEQVGRGVFVRREGRLATILAGSAGHAFDYGEGPTRSLAVSWGDVSTAYFSTGIPNIAVYFAATPALDAALLANRVGGRLLAQPAVRAFLAAQTRWLPAGPSADQRRGGSVRLVAEADDARGRVVRARLTTPEVYSFTATTAVAIAERILAGDVEAGYQTPSRVFGADFVLGLPGVSRAAA